jgi:hypothetical protein
MDIVEQLLETIYKVYNPQEETKETARTYDSENLRNMFIGTIFGGEHLDTINNLRDCIDKMSDEWVAEFLRVINGDVVEQVNESVAQLKYFTFKKDDLKTSDDFKKAQEEMKKALREEPNMYAQLVIEKDMQTVKSWEQETIQESFNEDRLKERAKDAINALNDVIGYLRQGIGRRIDKADIETLEYATTILDDCMK